MYGPRQRKQVVFDILRKLRADPARIEILGDGSQERDFAYVQDVVQSLIVIATSAPGRGEAYNVASGTSHSISQLVNTWCKVLGLEPQITCTGQIRPGDAEKWSVDLSQIKQIGFQPQTSLEVGLVAVRDWYDQSFK